MAAPRRSRLVAAAALGLAALQEAPARAQDASLQAVLAATVGATDNVGSTPLEGDQRPEADGFGSVSPGLVFRYDTPRTAQTLSYTFTPSFFFRHSEANSYTGNGAWTGRYAVSPTTEVSLGLTGAHGQLNTLVLESAPGQTAIREQAPGGTEFVSGGVNQGLSKQLSPAVTMGEQASFLVYSPIAEDPARTYNLTGTLSAQRLFRHDTGALALTFAYTRFDNILTGVPGRQTLGARDQLLNTLIASWQHEYGRGFSSQIDLGVTQATDLGAEYAQLWQPVGLAAARYVRDEAQVELAITHSAQLNVYLTQISFVDQATLRLAAPLSAAARLGAEGSAGLQLARPIEDGVLGDPTTVILADAALLWSPITVIPDLELSLRYQRIHQISTSLAGSVPSDLTLVRNTVMLSISGAFPETEETGARILMTQPFGSTGPARRARREVSQQPEGEEPSRGEAE
ncbi:MAG: hypothetical protein IT372_18235 [Polyangiaceae bacterium]|nr:hypothetical protein [Polyangiaceae bacterium]